MTRRHLEDDLQRAVWTWYQFAKPSCVMMHVPNGGLRHAREAARFKGMGVVPGVADLILLWNGGCGAIELKSPTGRQSQAQRTFERHCGRHGIQYRICRSIDDVKAACEEWGLMSARNTTATSVRTLPASRSCQ